MADEEGTFRGVFLKHPAKKEDVEKALTHNSKTADDEPAWGGVDKKKLPFNAHANLQSGDQGLKSTWSHPHHFVRGGGSPDESGVFTTGTMFRRTASGLMNPMARRPLS